MVLPRSHVWDLEETNNGSDQIIGVQIAPP
jgi:hypothetical protein